MTAQRTAAALALAALLTATACSSTPGPSPANPAPAAGAATTTDTPRPVPAGDANASLAVLHAAVPSAEAGTVITEAGDPNHLLGRPGQYTSKITFTDTRINSSDVDGLDKDDVQRGGAVEVFTSPADAKARAAYIQGIVKSLPALLEYDYVHGPVVVRVSKLLPPSQAAEYDKAAAVFGDGS